MDRFINNLETQYLSTTVFEPRDDIAYFDNIKETQKHLFMFSMFFACQIQFKNFLMQAFSDYFVQCLPGRPRK